MMFQVRRDQLQAKRQNSRLAWLPVIALAGAFCLPENSVEIWSYMVPVLMLFMQSEVHTFCTSYTNVKTSVDLAWS